MCKFISTCVHVCELIYYLYSVHVLVVLVYIVVLVHNALVELGAYI